ncbi:hypothetical protein Sjap_017213 [Stephania japonica]|uniref:Protein FAR1-RELATED SEQUENCE n=1 Tax=Stephania japonica TaxID=461633 RepID=A0AAP0I5R8_9MAGN
MPRKLTNAEEEDNTRPNTGTKKCQCPFLIQLKEHPDSYWYVSVVCGMHNHNSANFLERHSYAGRLTQDEAAILDQMSKANVRPRQILNTLKQRDKNNASTLRTIYNARQRNRIKEAGGRTQMQQLLHLLEDNMYLSWHRKDPESNVVTETCFGPIPTP